MSASSVSCGQPQAHFTLTFGEADTAAATSAAAGKEVSFFEIAVKNSGGLESPEMGPIAQTAAARRAASTKIAACAALEAAEGHCSA